MKKLLPLILILMISVKTLTAQDNSPLARAQKLQTTFAYSDAIPLYIKALEKQPENDIALRGLAECYRMTNQTDKAEIYYLKLKGTGKSDNNDKFYLAKIMMSNGKYPEAKKYFDEYLQKASNDDRAKNSLDAINNLNNFLKDSLMYKIYPLSISSEKADFAPVKLKASVVFISSRGGIYNKQKQHSWTGSPYLSMYQAEGAGKEFKAPAPYASELISDFNDGPVSFSPSGDELFITRNNSKLLSRNDKTSRLKIVYSKLQDGKWMTPSELPFNRAQYNTAHASISPDGKRMYFSSDMPGGKGGMDIYYSERNGDTWGDPVNLGPKVNTPGNETFPFAHTNGILYFSSDGWSGLGGMDIFYTNINDKSLKAPVNPGYPFNTHRDDFGTYINEDGKSGYLSSNRSGGRGDDDIYYFEIRQNITVFGTVADKETLEPIAYARVIIRDNTGVEIGSVVADEQGKYSYDAPLDTDLHLASNPEGFFSGSIKTSTKGLTAESLKADILLEKIVINKPIVLDNIYYDLGKWNIRKDAEMELNKLVTILQENPGITIELGSHTDSRAGDDYNLKLSEKRAKSATEYIVKTGNIATSRVVSKGYGETQLVNNCKNGVKCNEEEHQKNRRTEFKVISQ